MYDLPNLDKNNAEFNFALDFVMQTSRLVYLTGKAGTGKTTFLRYLQTVCSKRMVVLAPTGVAAINAGGQTIHSFFNIKPSVYVPGDKRLRNTVPSRDEDKTMITDHFRYQREKLELIRNLELLIIDEISMVRCDLLDVIDQILRFVRKRFFTPFGGVQVLLIGDTFQLPPIANMDDWSILSSFYSSPHFFSSKVMQTVKPVYIELKKIYRQKDNNFIELLNRIRINKLHFDDIRVLNSRFLHGFDPEDADDYIILASHNRMVVETNQRRLEALPGEHWLFEADVEGIFPEGNFPADRLLKVKKEAQIMMLRNDRNRRYFNGKIGHIESISENSIKVKFAEGNTVDVLRETWDNIRYKWDPKNKKVVEESIGTFLQFPLKLAWAITVHKSQGLTFDKVIADVNEAFTHGQVYVALSRCTSFQGLLLRTPMASNAIKTDTAVLKFATLETPDTILLKELEKSKNNYYLKTALRAWIHLEVNLAIDSFVLYLERNDSNPGKAYALCSFACARFLRKSAAVYEVASTKLSDAELLLLNEKEQKRRDRAIDSLLKAGISQGKALNDLFEKIQEDENAEEVLARFSYDIENITNQLSVLLKNRKSTGAKTSKINKVK